MTYSAPQQHDFSFCFVFGSFVAVSQAPSFLTASMRRSLRSRWRTSRRSLDRQTLCKHSQTCRMVGTQDLQGTKFQPMLPLSQAFSKQGIGHAQMNVVCDRVFGWGQSGRSSKKTSCKPFQKTWLALTPKSSSATGTVLSNLCFSA